MDALQPSTLLRTSSRPTPPATRPNTSRVAYPGRRVRHRGASRHLAMIRRQATRRRVKFARGLRIQPPAAIKPITLTRSSLRSAAEPRRGSIPGPLTDSGPARPSPPLRRATRATSLPPARSRDRSLHARSHPGASRSRYHDEPPTPMPTRWPVALKATAGERSRPRRAVSEPSRSSTGLPRSTTRSSSTDTYPDSVTSSPHSRRPQPTKASAAAHH